MRLFFALPEAVVVFSEDIVVACLLAQFTEERRTFANKMMGFAEWFSLWIRMLKNEEQHLRV